MTQEGNGNQICPVVHEANSGTLSKAECRKLYKTYLTIAGFAVAVMISMFAWTIWPMLSVLQTVMLAVLLGRIIPIIEDFAIDAILKSSADNQVSVNTSTER